MLALRGGIQKREISFCGHSIFFFKFGSQYEKPKKHTLKRVCEKKKKNTEKHEKLSLYFNKQTNKKRWSDHRHEASIHDACREPKLKAAFAMTC